MYFYPSAVKREIRGDEGEGGKRYREAREGKALGSETCFPQSWALPLQVAVVRYLANSEKMTEIADLKRSGISYQLPTI
jgi:hypothetical protein